ncbi:carbohydrate sulfotransferase 9-like [Antedon mediterranea]|uniref:carbohydrate sulfotransferase 9-like n=1 Tax=Antedon mediterranea TaxID=105859 RepID=UPI003AF7FB00
MFLQVLHATDVVKSQMTSDEFMKKYAEKNKNFTRYVKDMCKKYRKKIPKMKKYPHHTVFNEKHKFALCQTPKVATNSWSRLFLVLSGYKNYSEIQKMSAPSVSAAWKIHVPRLVRFPLKKQKEIMRDYTKVMFVRNPYTRLLSAYSDKLVAKNASDYRHDVHDITTKGIRTNLGLGKSKNDLKFGEFVKMLISKKPILNIHWGKMSTRCHPCDIDYDIIGRMEDIDNYANYILKLIGSDLQFPKPPKTHFTNSSSHDRLVRNYSEISDSELESLYQTYLYDFLLFGYKKELPIE